MFASITRSATVATLRHPRVYGPAVSMVICAAMMFMSSVMLVAVGAPTFTRLAVVAGLVVVLRPEYLNLVEGVRYQRKWDASAVQEMQARMASGLAVPRG